MYKNLLFLFVLQVFVIVNAFGADKEGMYVPKGVGWKSCNDFLHDYGSSGIEKKKNSEFSYNAEFGQYIGWFWGYMTHVNAISPGKNDHYSDTSILDVLGWVSSWCRENPNKAIANAMETYTNFKLKPFVAVNKKTSGPYLREKLIYEPISKPTFEVKRAECESHLKGNRLTTGQNGNAYDCFNQIRTLYIENQDAAVVSSNGIKRISEKYIALIENAIGGGDLQKAKTYISKLENIDPRNSKINGLKQNLHYAESRLIEKAEVKRRDKTDAMAAHIKNEVERVTSMTHLNSAEQAKQLPRDVAYALAECMTSGYDSSSVQLMLAMTLNDPELSRNLLNLWSMAPCD